uniref:cellulase N-terminal Ig-like domain-containing protein n=1 Tax=Enterocloster clostridioformis TaxID=1531 RepID=UPI001C3D5EA6|nr:cellulase N-terminal Ig-like domain-containing protein [Enterocloster clostridioformis]
MRMYINQAGYLPGEKKKLLLVKEAEEGMSEAKSRKYPPETVKVFDQDGKCILEKEAVYQGYDREAGDLVWLADICRIV